MRRGQPLSSAICSLTVALLLVAAPVWSGFVESEAKAEQNAPAGEKSASGYTLDEKTTEATCDSWSNHFRVFEVADRGAKRFRLGSQPRAVDASSFIEIERISTLPETIEMIDHRQTKPDYTKLDIDVVTSTKRVPRSWAGACNDYIAAPTLQKKNPFSSYKQEQPGCPWVLRVSSLGRTIRSGEKFAIPAGSFQHGQRVEIQFSHQAVGSHTRGSFDSDKKICTVETTEMCATDHTVVFYVVDFSQIAPQEATSEGARVIVDRARVDIASEVFVDFPASSPVRLELDEQLRDSIVIETTAIQGDESRKVAGRQRGVRRLIGELNDDEKVQITVKRRIKDGDAEHLVEVGTFEFKAVAVGLHYQPAGNFSARYTTSSMLTFILDKDENPAFSQTFSYSMFYKPRSNRVLGEIGMGVHIAVLPRGETETMADGSEEASTELGIGLGGQITLGDNIVHLGGGYDFGRDRAYLSLGLSVPEFGAYMSELIGK